MHRNLSIGQVDKLLDNGEAQPDALVVHLRRPVQLPKPREKLGEVFSHDARASVTYVHDKQAQLRLEASFYGDLSIFCKLERVFYKVYYYLLQMFLVSA